MLKCKICGHEFNPIAENHYLAYCINKIGDTSIYDVFDCPKCECQVVAQKRKLIGYSHFADEGETVYELED